MPVVKMPDGSEVPVVRVGFRPVKEDWSVVELTDGGRIRVRTVVLDVLRTPLKDEMGQPVYVIRHQALVVSEPQEGARGPEA